ncbi:MAG TPA: hypothetical protein VFK39_03385 [Gemmatimonadaceae bacterium]|nr:hypothetical protein [Gemmatimonadaceae bacterium]
MIPQNAGYYHAAYIIAVILYGGYAVTLWARRRTIRRRSEAAGSGLES